MKPYYDITSATLRNITELVWFCSELNLGNVSFSYYQDQIDFHLSENKHGWELVVKLPQGRDIYKVEDSSLIYQYSEN